MEEKIYSTAFLTKIIDIQSQLTEVDFNLNGFMQLVAEQIEYLTSATGAVVELIEGDEMVYRAATGTVSEYLGLRLKITNSISGLCISTNSILLSEDTETDSRVNLEACRKVSARSLIVAPLIYRGNPVGVLKILSKKPAGFNETDMKILQLMAGLVASGLAHQIAFDELKVAQKRLYHLAHYDSLTDLANRQTFRESLLSAISKVKESSSIIALMYLDIDHFKKINDTLGHNVGDALLKDFACRIKKSVPKNALIARMGGDEFVILIENISHKEDVYEVAKNIIKAMSEKFASNKKHFHITTSIGITFYEGKNIYIDALIKEADTALYEAKQNGRNRYHVFS